MENSFRLLDDDDLQLLWEQYRKNLSIREHQAAAYGIDAPLHIINDIGLTKDKLAQLSDEFARRNTSPYAIDPAKNRGRQLYNAISLNNRQQELLTQLVDAVRTASEPSSFLVMETNDSLAATIVLVGSPQHRLTGYMVDVRALAHAGVDHSALRKGAANRRSLKNTHVGV